MLTGKRILLIVSGGIAAYKTPDLVRLIRKSGGTVQCILTPGGARFVTPLTLSAVSGNPVYEDLWSLKDEAEMGHIRLSRESDLIVVAPASANILAKITHGLADDLATATILASDKPVIVCPAMNPLMWANPSTQANINILDSRGIHRIGPEDGDMACGETGTGRMAEPETIVRTLIAFFQTAKSLSGLSALVTSGPTFEPVDPVRFIGNRSSGKQGHAVVQALAQAGASVTLVTGPVALPDPQNIKTVRIETANKMLEFVQKNLPFDIAVCAAAVSDWSPVRAETNKIKKGSTASPPRLDLMETPDILKTLSEPGMNRPKLVVGFAAETENALENAIAKRVRKGCDWILANDVSASAVFGADANQVWFITPQTQEHWPLQSKTAVAAELVRRIATHFERKEPLS